jgi:hypothetical protein
MSYPDQLGRLHARVGGDRLVASAAGHVIAPSRSAATRAGQGPTHFAGERLGLTAGNGVPGCPDEFAEGLLDLHRDLLAAAVGHAIAHLDARHSEGAPLLARPQIQAELAGIAAELRLDAAPVAGNSRWARHRRLVAAGRGLLHLLGASSMLAGGPGADLYLAELTGNVYLHPGPGQSGDQDD